MMDPEQKQKYEEEQAEVMMRASLSCRARSETALSRFRSQAPGSWRESSGPNTGNFDSNAPNNRRSRGGPSFAIHFSANFTYNFTANFTAHFSGTIDWGRWSPCFSPIQLTGGGGRRVSSRP